MTVRKRRLFPIFILMSLAILPRIGFAQCSADDIRSYVEGGATAQQLSQLCGGAGQGGYNYSNPHPARSCVTRWGACQMAVQLPVGSGCACYTASGPVPGVAR
jgi:hypothetical protein